MKRKNIGIFIIFATLMFSLINLSLTGSVIGSNSNNSYFSIFVAFVFFLGTFLLISGRSLDAIVIPTGTPTAEKRRTDRAYKEYKSRGAEFFLISGIAERDEHGKIARNSHTKHIYDQLRSYNIKPSQIKIEGKSRDTEENVEYSFKRLKREHASRIGIASSKDHLDRFSNLIEQGKTKGDIPNGVKIYRLTTKQGVGERIYGLAAKAYHNIIPGKPPKFIKKIGDAFFH